MIKLSGAARAPSVIDCQNGVTLTVQASTSASRSAARRAAHAMVADDPDRLFYDAFVHALAHRGITAWSGVGNVDGEVIEPTPDGVSELLNLSDTVFRAFEVGYVTPILELDAEKNASSAAPSGTTRRMAGTTAGGAAKTSAPNARSQKTPRKPTQAKRSGK
jgi:hypothetical protein